MKFADESLVIERTDGSVDEFFEPSSGRSKVNGFLVDTGYSSRSVAYHLRFGQKYVNQCSMSCRIEEKSKSPENWNGLIDQIANQWSIVGAWQWTHLYRVWQWMVDISNKDHYESNYGKIPPGVSSYIKGSVPGGGPNRTFVDISKFPGRPKQLLPTISFYPTAEMWLGLDFWQYAKCTKEEVLAADFFIEKQDTPNFLYLKCWPQAFTRPDGEQGRMQQRLWKLFFHEDGEWPPGSGTISDEPMYGPPELMPGYQS